jgi:serine/threonine protein kinase
MNSRENVQGLCPLCGKTISTSGQGSLTGWLFAEVRCTCRLSSEISPEPTELNGQQPLTDNFQATKLSDNFTILAMLGSGSIGTVYKVQDDKTKSIYAAKVLLPEHVRNPIAVRRFEQEINSVKEFAHPKLIKIYGAGKTGFGSPYFLMDYLDGKDLAKLLAEEGRVESSRSLNIFTQMCEGIGYVHNKGIVHRDLKPANVIVLTNETIFESIKIVDFGIAKAFSENANSTQTGEVFGSPNYMSPEQCKGENIDSRSDLYSMGCVLHEMLTGKPLFIGENPVKTILKHINEQPVSMLINYPGLNIPKAIDVLVLNLLAKRPEDRYQSAEQVLSELALVRKGKIPVLLKARVNAEDGPNKQHKRLVPRILASCASLAVIVGIGVFYLAGKANPEWRRLNDDAMNALKMNDNNRAYKLWVKAFALAEVQGGQPPDLILLCDHIGAVAPEFRTAYNYHKISYDIASKSNLAYVQEFELGKMARLLELNGDLPGAAKQYLALANFKRELKGVNDKSYLADLRLSAYLFYQAKDFDLSESLFRQVLQSEVATARDTYSACNYLGYFSAVKGKYVDAMRYYGDAYKLSIKIFGPNHQTTKNLKRAFDQAANALVKSQNNTGRISEIERPERPK